MIAKQVMLIGVAVAVIVSCETKDANQKYFEERKDKLEDFVDSVETVVNRESNPNWTAIDRRYETLRSDLQLAEDASSVNARRDWQELAERYAKAKAKSRPDMANLDTDVNAEALVHLNRVESRGNSPTPSRQQNTDNTIDNIEEGTEESLAWLEENFEKLNADLQERYNNVKADFRN
jgi:hypothetical protein